MSRRVLPLASPRTGSANPSAESFATTPPMGFPLPSWGSTQSYAARKQTRPRPWGSGRANVTLHLLPCAARAGNANGIQSIPAIQGCADRGRMSPAAGRSRARIPCFLPRVLARTSTLAPKGNISRTIGAKFSRSRQCFPALLPPPTQHNTGIMAPIQLPDR